MSDNEHGPGNIVDACDSIDDLSWCRARKDFSSATRREALSIREERPPGGRRDDRRGCSPCASPTLRARDLARTRKHFASLGTMRKRGVREQ